MHARSTTEPTREGQRLIDTWLNARTQMEMEQLRIKSVERDLKDAENALAHWLLPPVWEPGERIGIWYGDKLLMVRVSNHSVQAEQTFKVEMQTRRLTTQPLASAPAVKHWPGSPVPVTLANGVTAPSLPPLPPFDEWYAHVSQQTRDTLFGYINVPSDQKWQASQYYDSLVIEQKDDPVGFALRMLHASEYIRCGGSP